MSGSMKEVDVKLDAGLRRRRARGVVDIKCHVDVSATTDPEDFKRALVNVFDQDEQKKVTRVPVGEFNNFANFFARFRAS